MNRMIWDTFVTELISKNFGDFGEFYWVQDFNLIFLFETNIDFFKRCLNLRDVCDSCFIFIKSFEMF